MVCARQTLILSSQRVARVAITLSPQIARPMTHTQAGIRPQRTMLAMDTDNWDHSPPAQG